MPLSRFICIAHEFNIPVIVNAAAEPPPLVNLTSFIRMGADLVVFSGGKYINAPGDTGLILANNLRLLEACRLMSPFRYINVNGQTRVFIGRAMKISKEDIIALVAALEEYVKVNHEERLSVMNKMANEVISELTITTVFPSLKVEIKLLRSYTKLYIRPLKEGIYQYTCASVMVIYALICIR